MNKYFSHLEKTTFDEIAADTDSLSLYEEYYFASYDKNNVNTKNEIFYEYYTIGKVHFDFQDSSNYSILIKRMDGSQVELKSIDIISDGNIDNEDERIWGIRNFLEEYYQKNMPQNSSNEIYYYYKYAD